MSILTKSAKPDESRGLVRVSAARAKQSNAALSAPPRANLLPPEVGQRKRSAAIRSRVRLAVIVIVIAVVGAVVASFLYSAAGAAKLAASEAESAQLNAKLNTYSDLEKIQGQVATLTAAQKVGGSPDVDWAGYLDRINATLPQGVSITATTISSRDIQGATTPPTAVDGVTPLATITFQVSATDGSLLPGWIDSLSTLPGYLAADTGTVTGGATGYSATVTLVIGPDALSHRFVSAAKGAKK